ncbi:partitioning defective 6 homolog gamma-like [Hydractinia symbiolongicarpus]|uniref:partitioning defective 6 homolog gamma-like n=1 Tax=Hydractinia symbiolongicarpus TaxID=13093 RepID=UPI002550ACC1|nr:partitioning defective 6 homolog gamma-like [Hydractinia symbiolongicarpus]
MSHRKKVQAQVDLSLIEVKSKFEAEFRRFSLKRDQLENFTDFYDLLEQTHNLEKMVFSIYYRHPQHGDLLPINNTENFMHALGTAVPLLRLFIQRGDMPEPINSHNVSKRHMSHNPQAAVVNRRLQISVPQDFRRVSAIIDVDILPESIRRVRLCKHNSDKPLGFYIRDGTSVRVTAEGLEKVPGIFVSRLVPGGLAESTGLLSVNDEVLEVNGIEVSGKSLDQVTEMMVANSQNLIVTVKPVHQGQESRLQNRSGAGHTISPLAKNNTNTPSGDMDIIDSDEDDGPVVTGDGVVHV